MFFILLIIFLLNSYESIPATFSPTETSQYDVYRKSKHTYTTFSARLIHRSSPEFPFFNPNYTRDDHVRNSIRTSIDRSHYFSQRKARSETNYVAAPIHGYEFTMNYTIGTPAVHRYGILDTGSSFTWFQCLPCIRCYNQNNYPIYNPRKSASYQQVLCNTYQCSMAPDPSCINSSQICRYSIRYTGGSVSRGIVSMDTMTLSADNTAQTLKNAVFGCANDSQDRYRVPGIVGVSNHSSSLHIQLGVSHFSYFVFANETNLDGEAHFGPGASLSGTGANTPFLPSGDGLYYLNLTGISVDGSDLDLPSNIFDKDGVTGGVIIDSGSTYTSLPNEVYEKLKEAVADEMYMYTQVKSGDEDWELCYEDYDVNKEGAPEVVFQFSGLDYALCNSNLWVRVSKLVCLAILRSQHNIAIIGMYQQRNVEVGYDLDKNLLTLNSLDACPDEVIDFIQ